MSANLLAFALFALVLFAAAASELRSWTIFRRLLARGFDFEQCRMIRAAAIDPSLIQVRVDHLQSMHGDQIALARHIAEVRRAIAYLSSVPEESLNIHAHINLVNLRRCLPLLEAAAASQASQAITEKGNIQLILQNI